ncbi:hypothetical protein PCANC_15414 [Puccinia coronata f. sp. avenae]|uniref:Uncharacterized protein n=1 Tax=Puccinia coronata f. sp. avenae TaxID=200324 RepID=A0A2N5SWK2_9BASI|nr:hypothetical protein PCANC_15414 [Puccinia coronata f. sp. avenae]
MFLGISPVKSLCSESTFCGIARPAEGAGAGRANTGASNPKNSSDASLLPTPVLFFIFFQVEGPIPGRSSESIFIPRHTNGRFPHNTTDWVHPSSSFAFKC